MVSLGLSRGVGRPLIQSPDQCCGQDIDSQIISLFLDLLTYCFRNENFVSFFGSSFIDWNSACEGQFPNMYCPLDLNDYNAFPEGKCNSNDFIIVSLFSES